VCSALQSLQPDTENELYANGRVKLYCNPEAKWELHEAVSGTDEEVDNPIGLLSSDVLNTHKLQDLCGDQFVVLDKYDEDLKQCMVRKPNDKLGLEACNLNKLSQRWAFPAGDETNKLEWGQIVSAQMGAKDQAMCVQLTSGDGNVRDGKKTMPPKLGRAGQELQLAPCMKQVSRTQSDDEMSGAYCHRGKYADLEKVKRKPDEPCQFFGFEGDTPGDVKLDFPRLPSIIVGGRKQMKDGTVGEGYLGLNGGADAGGNSLSYKNGDGGKSISVIVNYISMQTHPEHLNYVKHTQKTQ